MTATVTTAAPPSVPADAIPEYLSKTYTWAYLSRRTMRWLDRPAVVSAILWGNAGRLMRSSISHFAPGERVLQAACVYGTYTPQLAEQIGGAGELTVTDVAAVQLDNVAPKLAPFKHVRLHRGDLSRGHTGVEAGSMDAVACFFLLHEVPPEHRRRIVEALLGCVRLGGRVVFTDYHRMAAWNPLRPVMAFVFRTLEPFADSLLDQSLDSISPHCEAFRFEKRTLFGGLYQEVVATRVR